MSRRSTILPSWRVAAVLHPTEKTSFYVMRGTSFNPSADNLTIAVTNFLAAQSLLALEPEQTETTEIGAKAEVLERQPHAAERGVQHRQDQPARPQSGTARRHGP